MSVTIAPGVRDEYAFAFAQAQGAHREALRYFDYGKSIITERLIEVDQWSTDKRALWTLMLEDLPTGPNEREEASASNIGKDFTKRYERATAQLNRWTRRVYVLLAKLSDDDLPRRKSARAVIFG